MRMDTWVLIGLFVWIGLCIAVDALLRHDAQLKRLREELRDEKRRHCVTKIEFQTLQESIEVEKRHACIRRDVENDGLRKELMQWKTRCSALETAMNNMWPKTPGKE